MKFHSKPAIFVGSLIMACSSFAFQGQPAACPGMASLQSEGMINSAEILEGMYLTYTQSHYDTNSSWVFIMGPIMAESDEIALSESNQFLTTMSGNPEPTQDEEGNWTCEYDTKNQDLAAFAIQTEEEMSPGKMNKYLTKVH